MNRLTNFGWLKSAVTSGFPWTARVSREWLKVAALAGLLIAYLLAGQGLTSPGDDRIYLSSGDFRVVDETGGLHTLESLQAELERDDGPVTFRAEMEIPSTLRARPSALFLSGLFSAEVYWDGQRIGSKGEPGTTELEEAGAIDAVFFVPPELLVGDTHELLLRVSATRNLYRPSAIIHGIAFGPYRADERRPVTAYLPALMLGGLIAGLGMLHLLGSAPARGAYALAAACLLLALGAETSRSLINYSYDWHPLRLGMVVVGLAGFAAFVLWAVAPKERARLWLLAFGGMGLAGVLLWRGFDGKAATFVITGLVAIAGASAQRLGLRHPRTFFAGMLALTALALDLWNEVYFLDSAVYMIGMLSIAVALVPQQTPSATRKIMEPRFRVRGPRGEVFHPFGQIVRFVAEGDGVEVHLADGTTAYHGERLGQVEKRLPEDFMRVHRSAIVNLARVRRLRSEPGSKYVAVLDTGEEIRVARAQVSALRERLQTGEGDVEDAPA